MPEADQSYVHTWEKRVGGLPPGPFDPYSTPQGWIHFIGTYHVSINHKFHIETFESLNL